MDAYFWIVKKIYGRMFCPILGYVVGRRDAEEEPKKECCHTLYVEIRMISKTSKAINKDRIINITL